MWIFTTIAIFQCKVTDWWIFQPQDALQANVHFCNHLPILQPCFFKWRILQPNVGYYNLRDNNNNNSNNNNNNRKKQTRQSKMKKGKKQQLLQKNPRKQEQHQQKTKASKQT